MQKYKKFFGIKVGILLFFLLAPNALADTNNISGLVFTTNIQTVKSGEISKSITIQTQNSSGASEPVSETNDVTFTSTSATGSFLNSSGNAVSTTMSKNTSSRTFYYKDSTLGTFDLTISIKGRETGKIFSVAQQIIISDTETTSTTTGTSTSSGGSTTTTSTDQISSHSSQVSISVVPEVFELKVSAGRKRFALTDTKVKFSAAVEDNVSGSYEWAFGDGASASGKNVEHIYSFPGEYNVVLNAKSDGDEAVSRTEIEIVEADISIKEVKVGEGGYVEILNNSSYETNIGDFNLRYASSTYSLPRDTIIMPERSIKIPLSVSPNFSVVLEYPEGKQLASLEPSLIISEEKERLISELEEKLLSLQVEAEKIRLAQDISSQTIASQEILQEKVSEKDENINTTLSVYSNTDQTAALLNSFENHEENQGWISKSFKFIKGIFGY